MSIPLKLGWNRISTPPKVDGVYRLYSLHDKSEMDCRYSVKHIHWGECLSLGPVTGYYTHWKELDNLAAGGLVSSKGTYPANEHK